MQHKKLLVVAVVVAAFTAFSEDSYAAFETVTVSDNYRTFISNNVKFVASTFDFRDYPIAKQPMFWIDCTKTNGWNVGADMTVTKVTSRRESNRYLTCDYSEINAANYPQNLYYGAHKNKYIKPPVLVPFEAGSDSLCLDFGRSPLNREGGLKALFFNPDPVDGSNRMSGIGTIVGVYKSYAGGGNILGGKEFARMSGYAADKYGTNRFEAVVHGKPSGMATATVNVRDGIFWQGHQRSIPHCSRWSCDWDVVALNPTALVNSDGICGNVDNCDDWRSCGGQAIAEILIFDEILDEEDVEKLISHLEIKWLGRRHRGTAGNAQLSWLEIGGFSSGEGSIDSILGIRPVGGVDVPVEVGDGEKLTINRLMGGRSAANRKHKIVKTGAGALRLNDAEAFGGIVEVREGSLELGGKAVPEFSGLAPWVYLHLDPSVASSVTSADGLVSAIENLGDTSRGVLSASQAEEASRPELMVDFPSENLNMLDFKTVAADDRRHLTLTENVSLQTLILVVDSSIYSGTSFMNRFFESRAGQPYKYDNWYDMKTGGFFTTTKLYISDYLSYKKPYDYGQAWVNGRKIDITKETYDAPGLNVVALRVPAGSSKFLGGLSAEKCGGMRIGEVLGWQYALSEEQIFEVQAYLMKKWLKRAAPGYRLSDSETVPDIQSVVLSAGSKIHIPENTIATLGALKLEGIAEKTGGGVLRVCSGTGTERLVIKEGRVATSETPDPVAAGPALNPSLHFDPSDLRFVRTNEYGGTNYIWTIMDRCGRISAHESFYTWIQEGDSTPFYYRFPYVDDSRCNGLTVACFGEMYCGEKKEFGKRMRLTRRMMNVRSVYFVLGSQDGGGNPLGYSSGGTVLGARDWNRFDFFRGFSQEEEVMRNTPLWGGVCAEAVINGELYIDGVRKDAVRDYIPNGGFELVELHTTSGCEFSALGHGGANWIFGGFKLGEMIVFERELTEREKTATRNYLLKKWFGRSDDELAALPEKAPMELLTCKLGKVVVDAGAPPVQMMEVELEIAEDVEVEIRNLPLDGTPVTVMIADTVGEIRRFRKANFTGVGIPENKMVRFDFTDGKLTARLTPRFGLGIIVR